MHGETERPTENPETGQQAAGTDQACQSSTPTETTGQAKVALPATPFRMFTFGTDHLEQHGLRRDACVIFEGEGDLPRARMHQRFGRDWAAEYLPDAARKQIEWWSYVPLTPAELPPVRTDLPPEVDLWIQEVLIAHGEPIFARGTPYEPPDSTEYMMKRPDVTYRVNHLGQTFRDDGSRVWPADSDFRTAMASVHLSGCVLSWDHIGKCARGPANHTPEVRADLTERRKVSKSVQRGEDAARTLYVRGGAVPQMDTLVYPGEKPAEVRAALRAYAWWLLDLADRA
jgi:hypothetical protein